MRLARKQRMPASLWDDPTGPVVDLTQIDVLAHLGSVTAPVADKPCGWRGRVSSRLERAIRKSEKNGGGHEVHRETVDKCK